jgi:hypothetical protein
MKRIIYVIVTGITMSMLAGCASTGTTAERHPAAPTQNNYGQPGAGAVAAKMISPVT